MFSVDCSSYAFFCCYVVLTQISMSIFKWSFDEDKYGSVKLVLLGKYNTRFTCAIARKSLRQECVSKGPNSRCGYPTDWIVRDPSRRFITQIHGSLQTIILALFQGWSNNRPDRWPRNTFICEGLLWWKAHYHLIRRWDIPRFVHRVLRTRMFFVSR